MKFKVGDTIRLLPSATDMSIPEDEVGKTGVIEYYRSPINMRVDMDKPRIDGFKMKWYVDSFCIEHINMTGQLLFDFMKEGSK